jgi:hypothetical protein
MIRTTLAVDEKIAKEFSKIVKEKSKVIFSVTNSAIQLTTELLKDDVDPEEVHMYWQIFKLMGLIDVIPLPGTLNEKILNTFYNYEKEKVYELFYETGKEVANKFKIYMSDLIQILNAVKNIAKFFPLRKIEFSKVTDKLGERYKLVLIGAGLSLVTSKCLHSFIKGFIEVYNATVISEVVSVGFINIEFKV